MTTLFILKGDAKGLPKDTYLELAACSANRLQWKFTVSWHDNPEIRATLTLYSNRFFQLHELKTYLLVSVLGNPPTDTEQELINILNGNEAKNDKSKMIIEPTEQSEDIFATTTTESVGLSENNDSQKLEVAALIGMITGLNNDARNLIPDAGITLEDLGLEVKNLIERQKVILEILNGPSMIKGVFDYNERGIYGLIHDYNPMLLEAASIIRAAKCYIKQRGNTTKPNSPTIILPCEEQSRAGEVIIKWWKKYKSYTAIWAGSKWRNRKLRENLGQKSSFVSVFPKNLDQTGKKNPIKLMSNDNIVRLKKTLKTQAEFLVKQYPMLAEKQIDIHQANVFEAADVLTESHKDLYEEFKQLDRQVKNLSINVATDQLSSSLSPTPLGELIQKRKATAEKLNKMEAQLNAMAEAYDKKNPVTDFGLLPDEIELFKTVLDLPFTIKHATPNWFCIRNDGSLDSLMEYQKKNPNWNSEFSTPGNIDKLGNHGFVFFRVDVGDDEIVTRYGATQIVADLSFIENDGWISLFDQLKPLSSVTMQRYYDHEGNLIRYANIGKATCPFIEYTYGLAKVRKNDSQATSFAKSQLRKGDETYNQITRTEPFTNFVFYGPQIRLGIALSMIHELRYFFYCGYREHILESFSKLNQINKIKFLRKLLGQTFRPEGKYPVALRFTEHPAKDLKVSKPEGDRRWNKDGTASTEIMTCIKVIQQRKFLIDSISQANKMTAYHEKLMKQAKEKLNNENLSSSEAEAEKIKFIDQQKKMEEQACLFQRYTKMKSENDEQYANIEKTHPELIEINTFDTDANSEEFRHGI